MVWRWKEYLYVGEPTSIKRYKYDSKAMTAGAGEQIIAYGKDYGQGHGTRSLLFDRKGEKLYVGVGSRTNVDAGDAEDRTAINPAARSTEFPLRDEISKKRPAAEKAIQLDPLSAEALDAWRWSMRARGNGSKRTEASAAR
jgi:glucose/arabinose dehydrogenase